MKESRTIFWQRDWFCAALLLIATLLAYAPAWNGKPIWDDDAHLTKPELQSWHGLGEIWTHLGSTQQYYPFVHTIFWIEHKLWGDVPIFYHFVNILLHVCSAFLLVRILNELKIPGAWLAAGIFSLHPVQVESVAWISELKNTLSGVFFFSAALAYLTFDRSRNLRPYFFALGLFALGLLSKSVVAILPAAILVVFWWKRGKLSFKSDIQPLIPFFVIGIAAGLFTAWVERTFIGAEGDVFHLSLVERTLISGRAFWFYLSKLFWPTDLTFIYPRWTINPSLWWQYLFPLATMSIFAVLWILRRKWRGPLAAFLLFVGMLFPVLGFLNVFPFIFSFVADHFQYLACIGIITLTSAGLTLLFENKSLCGWPVRHIIGAVVLGSLGGLTWRQTHMYRDAETLWRTTLSRNPSSWMAHNNLATTLQKKGQIEEAIVHYEQTITTRPHPEKAHYNLGAAFSQTGEVGQAIKHYEQAIAINPDYADAHYNLAGNFAHVGKLDDAVSHYEKTLDLRPDDVAAHNNLAAVLLQKGNAGEAIVHYETALRLRPNDAEIEYNLANAHFRSGQIDAAISHYEKAVAIEPRQAQAQYELGSALLQENRPDDAITHYREVLKIQPDHVKALINLGSLLLQRGDVPAAIPYYEKSLEIASDDVTAQTNLAWALATCSDPKLRNGERALELARRASTILGGKDPFALRSLAAAYAEAGQFSDAVDTANAALQIVSAKPGSALAKALAKEIEFYKAGLPYRTGGRK